MLFLADENVPGDVVHAMREDGHDVAWVLVDAPSSPDPIVLARAQTEERIVITFDKDFGELAFHAMLPATSGVILRRISTENPARAVQIIMAALRERADWAGHFSVIEGGQVRMTLLPDSRA